MRYDDIWEGRFESRPNRFIAYVNMCGKSEKVHVKNTGRCKETGALTRTEARHTIWWLSGRETE